jgi:transcriptional regulator with XRE-family HTH domain
LARLTPHSVDSHVGNRIRTRRKLRGLGQVALAQRIGVTFQQIQKYEMGANRVSASKLYDIARALQTPVAWFFEGLSLAYSDDPEGGDLGELALVDSFLRTPEGVELVKFVPRLTHRERRGLIALVREVAAEDQVTVD